MSKKLAGTLFVYNGQSQDYCYLESTQSLLEFCDRVFVVDAGSTDDTLIRLLGICNDKLEIIAKHNKDWQEQVGREKLSHFTNIAIHIAQQQGYEYSFNLQADEIIHEDSYEWIHKAINDNKEGYLCTRINLWGTPYHEVNVPYNRMPCSPQIVRLAKTYCRSVGDAESVAAQFNTEYVDKIRIYHMGFVRHKREMVKKCNHIQKEVFLIEPDEKLKGMEVFEPEKWFAPEDLKPISEPLPKIIQKWAEERNY
jgi:glycosyltransferase involved in cell wall biosynthesis